MNDNYANQNQVYAGLKYLEKDVPADVKAMFDPSWPPEDLTDLNPKAKDWEATLINKMLDLKQAAFPAKQDEVDVDDHDGTPIGEGDSISLVAAEVKMDQKAIESLPAAFRSGLFKPCGNDGKPCPSLPGAIRVSHTNAVDTDLMRIALKFDMSGSNDGSQVIDLHFTETLQVFPIADKAQLEAFSYMAEHGTASTLMHYPVSLAKMGYNANVAQKKYSAQVAEHGAPGKFYYSMSPFQIGGEDGAPTSAMKWRLAPKGRGADVPYPEVAEGGSVKQAMRTQFADVLSTDDVEFNLEIQIASDPVKHPVNDLSVEWDAPWTTMGSVRIPKQQFPLSSAELDAANAVGSGLWAYNEAAKKMAPDFNSKELLFSPANTVHKPLGDINRFRSHFYPKYDQARQEHLLGKKGGRAAKCPFGAVMNFLKEMR